MSIFISKEWPGCQHYRHTSAMVLLDLYAEAFKHTLRALGYRIGRVKVQLTRQASARHVLKASLAVNLVTLLLLLDGSLKLQWSRGWLRSALWPPPLPPPMPPYDLPQHIANHTALTAQQQLQCVGASQSYLLPPQHREQLGEMLEAMGGFYTGVELGVQRAVFSERMLSNWTSCRKYYLVDLWGHQDNYQDGANVPDEEQERIYMEARERLAPWALKTEFLRMDSVKAASFLPDGLDWVYVDARHDYCGVKADIEAWWHKLRPGGILAGHDYRGASAVWPKSDWSLCADGSRHPGAVMAAVNEWAMNHGLVVAATWGKWEWSSWMIRKPLSPVPCVIPATSVQGRYQQRFWPWRKRRGSSRGRSRASRSGDAGGVLGARGGAGGVTSAGLASGGGLLRGSGIGMALPRQVWPATQGSGDNTVLDLQQQVTLQPSRRQWPVDMAGEIGDIGRSEALQLEQVVQSHAVEGGGGTVQGGVGALRMQDGGWDDGPEQFQHMKAGEVPQA